MEYFIFFRNRKINIFECNFTKRIKEMNSQIKYNEQNLKKKR